MRIILGLIYTFLTMALFSQVPQKISYQAVVRDNNNELVISEEVGMKISILKEDIAGEVVYYEYITPMTNANGLVSFEIGNAFGFDQIDWSEGPFFVRTEIDFNGGTDYTLSGTNELLSVPFALYAGNVNNNDTSATNEIQTLELVGDTLSISGGNSVVLPIVGSSSRTLKFPDGRDSSVFVIKNIFEESYTVPSGKNFYMLSAQRSLRIEKDTFAVSYPPYLIISADKEIKGLDTESVIIGFEIDAIVTPFILNISESSYKVPPGKEFVFISVNFNVHDRGIMVNGINLNPNGSSDWGDDLPVVLASGDEIEGDIIINGYLRNVD